MPNRAVHVGNSSSATSEAPVGEEHILVKMPKCPGTRWNSRWWPGFWSLRRRLSRSSRRQEYRRSKKSARSGGPAAYSGCVVGDVSVGDKVGNVDSDEVDIDAVEHQCTSNIMMAGGEVSGARRWLLDGGSRTTRLSESLVPTLEYYFRGMQIVFSRVFPWE